MFFALLCITREWEVLCLIGRKLRKDVKLRYNGYRMMPCGKILAFENFENNTFIVALTCLIICFLVADGYLHFDLNV